MKSLQRKLKEDDDLAQLYRKEIQKDLHKAYIKEINGEQEENNTKWSLPHYGIVSTANPGKIRRIANATAVFNGTCLNDHLLLGPDLLNDLVGIILRSREKPLFITGDICFFMQVGVPKRSQILAFFVERRLRQTTERIRIPKTYLVPEIRNLWHQICLWYSNSFGGLSKSSFHKKRSPACAIYALQAARDNAENYPDVLETATTDFYMDDFVKSVGSTEEAQQLHQR